MSELPEDQSFETGCTVVCLGDVMVYGCSPCPQEVETGGSAQGHPCVLGELAAILGYMRPCPLPPMLMYCLQSNPKSTAHINNGYI